MKKWEKFSRDEIEQFVKESRSYSQLSFKLGYGKSISGSANKTMQEMVKELSLDVSHFTGQGWNKGNFDYSRFTFGKRVRPSDALKAIVMLRGYKCECCGITDWMGKKITFQIHHINGNHNDNTLTNLQVLCPNCHALTDNYKGKNMNNGTIVVSDEDIVKALNEYPNVRQALMAVGLTGKGGNYIRANELIQKYQIKKYLQ